jgi:hypothetical protein
MVRLSLSTSLALILLACGAPQHATASPQDSGPSLAATRGPSPTTPQVAAGSKPARTTPAARPAANNPPQVDWHARVAIAIEKLQKDAPELITQIEAMQPTRSGVDTLVFTQPELQDPRAAPILLRRLLAGADPVKVRAAIVDALPATGGDWQEGAAALVAVDSAPQVRKQLVEVMRYAGPASVHGLRLGFKDEDPEVNIAAARTAGFSKHGPELLPELYSSTFDSDWDLRAAAVQALGMLKLPQSRDVLVKALADESRDVRLQALLALESLDPEGLLELPELEKLAHDRKSHRIARKATQLLRKHERAMKAQRSKAKAPKAGDPPPLLAAPK